MNEGTGSASHHEREGLADRTVLTCINAAGEHNPVDSPAAEPAQADQRESAQNAARNVTRPMAERGSGSSTKTAPAPKLKRICINSEDEDLLSTSLSQTTSVIEAQVNALVTRSLIPADVRATIAATYSGAKPMPARVLQYDGPRRSAVLRCGADAAGDADFVCKFEGRWRPFMTGYERRQMAKHAAASAFGMLACWNSALLPAGECQRTALRGVIVGAGLEVTEDVMAEVLKLSKQV